MIKGVHAMFDSSDDAPLETIDFQGLYGKTAATLVNDWLGCVAALPSDTEKARALFQSMRESLGRR